MRKCKKSLRVAKNVGTEEQYGGLGRKITQNSVKRARKTCRHKKVGLELSYKR